MSDRLKSLKQAAIPEGEGGHGLDVKPRENRYAVVRHKMDGVIAGTESLSYTELQETVQELIDNA